MATNACGATRGAGESAGLRRPLDHVLYWHFAGRRRLQISTEDFEDTPYRYHM